MPDLQIRLTSVRDFPALALRWRALEARSQVSFFQSWSWVGCLAEDRYSDPVLLQATRNGEDVGLALLNRRRLRLGLQTLYLNETGDSDFDSMFVEHNGIVLADTAGPVLPDCLDRLFAIHPSTRLVMSGVSAHTVDAARASGHVMRLLRTEPSPFVDYAVLPDGDEGFLGRLSANTRYQLRRSQRLYSQRGTLAIRRATSVGEACVMLEALAVLHQRTWMARGRGGAFANPKFMRFHRALIAHAWPHGEIDLLQISAGDTVIGYLYNFLHRKQVLTYQSGFDYLAARPHEKPGMTSHQLAIGLYRGEGYARYDFLAGEDRYKTSLSNAATWLYWVDMVPQRSLRGVATQAWRAVVNPRYANTDTASPG